MKGVLSAVITVYLCHFSGIICLQLNNRIFFNNCSRIILSKLCPASLHCADTLVTLHLGLIDCMYSNRNFSMETS